MRHRWLRPMIKPAFRDLLAYVAVLTVVYYFLADRLWLIWGWYPRA